MDFDYQSLGRVLLGALPAVVAVIGLYRGPGTLRANLRHDIEMLEKLPEGSDARTKMLAFVDSQVERFAKLETEASRDRIGFSIGLFMSVGFGALGLWCATQGGFWWMFGAVWAWSGSLLSLGLLFDSAQRVPRDEKGTKITA